MSETGSADEWNGDGAQHWVTGADRYDGQLAPFIDLRFDRRQLAANEVVLDVGCGCGATTIGAARLSAAAVGIDLSVPMLVVGEQRAHVAGFAEIEVESVSPVITLGGGGTLDETLEFLLGPGIARALLDEAQPDAKQLAIGAVSAALAEIYEPGRGVARGTGAWLVSASRAR
ncbi:MAG: methyltransferase domain-containing protein [Ilumatobacteraceae bacterium]